MGIITTGSAAIWDAGIGQAPYRRVSSVSLPVERPKCVRSEDVVVVSTDILVWTEGTEIQGRTVKTVEIDSGTTINEFSLEKDWGVTAVASHVGRALVAWVERRQVFEDLSRDIRVRCVAARTGQEVLDLKFAQLGDNQTVDVLAFSPDGGCIAFGGSTGSSGVGVIDVAAQKVLWHKEVHGGPKQICFMPDGKSFFATDYCGGLRRYDAATGNVLWETTINLNEKSVFGNQAAERMMGLSVSPDGKHVAAAMGFSRRIGLWEVPSGKVVRCYQTQTNPIYVLLFSSDGKGLWFAGSQDTALQYAPIDF